MQKPLLCARCATASFYDITIFGCPCGATSFQLRILSEALEVSYFIDLTIFRLIISRSLRDPPLSHVRRLASPRDKNPNSLSTVAILAQGTSWAVASTQASFASSLFRTSAKIRPPGIEPGTI